MGATVSAKRKRSFTGMGMRQIHRHMWSHASVSCPSVVLPRRTTEEDGPKEEQGSQHRSQPTIFPSPPSPTKSAPWPPWEAYKHSAQITHHSSSGLRLRLQLRLPCAIPFHYWHSPPPTHLPEAVYSAIMPTSLLYSALKTEVAASLNS